MFSKLLQRVCCSLSVVLWASYSGCLLQFMSRILSAVSPSPRHLQMVLTSVALSLSLCSQVENNHRQVFELFSSQLAALFRSAYNLLKVC